MPAPAGVPLVAPYAGTTLQGPGGPGREVDGEAGFREPMLAQVGVGGPTTPDLLPGGSSCWLMEPKLDGLRGNAVRNSSGVTLYSRNRVPFNSRFPRLVAALADLPADDFVLSPIARTSSPFDSRVLEKAARWAEPSLVVEVAFAKWTTDGRLRHPSFVALRDDKPAAAVGREPCAPAAVPRRGSDKPQGWVGTQPGNRR